jgi:hypothetical protein
METYRTETTISANRALTIQGVPFRPGEKVEVIVLARPRSRSKHKRYPLRGQAIRYDRPFDSVAEDDWQALR